MSIENVKCDVFDRVKPEFIALEYEMEIVDADLAHIIRSYFEHGSNPLPMGHMDFYHHAGSTKIKIHEKIPIQRVG
jgi:hypothetical protein